MTKRKGNCFSFPKARKRWKIGFLLITCLLIPAQSAFSLSNNSWPAWGKRYLRLQNIGATNVFGESPNLDQHNDCFSVRKVWHNVYQLFQPEQTSMWLVKNFITFNNNLQILECTGRKSSDEFFEQPMKWDSNLIELTSATPPLKYLRMFKHSWVQTSSLRIVWLL